MAFHILDNKVKELSRLWHDYSDIYNKHKDLKAHRQKLVELNPNIDIDLSYFDEQEDEYRAKVELLKSKMTLLKAEIMSVVNSYQFDTL